MSKRDWIEVAVATVAGTGIGAALMYLFDPEVGEKRRAKAAELAGDYASSAGEALGAGWEHVSDGAHAVAKHTANLGGTVADYAGNLWSKGSSKVGDAADAAHGFFDDTRSHVRGWGRSASKSARGYANSASKALGREQHSAAGLTLGVVGALALGAGVMFLLDPAQGRRRRTLIRDKASSLAGSTADYARSAGRSTADYARTAGRAIADKTSSVASSARDYASQAVDAVKGAVGANGKDGNKEPTSSMPAPASNQSA